MGTMKALIDQVINQKSGGNSFQELNIQMKLMLKGIPVKKIDHNTPDDPLILEKIHSAAQDFNVVLTPVRV